MTRLTATLTVRMAMLTRYGSARQAGITPLVFLRLKQKGAYQSLLTLLPEIDGSRLNQEGHHDGSTSLLFLSLHFFILFQQLRVSR